MNLWNGLQIPTQSLEPQPLFRAGELGYDDGSFKDGKFGGETFITSLF